MESWIFKAALNYYFEGVFTPRGSMRREVETTTSHRWTSFEDAAHEKQILLNVHRFAHLRPVAGLKISDLKLLLLNCTLYSVQWETEIEMSAAI